MVPQIQTHIDAKIAELAQMSDTGDPALAKWPSQIAALVRSVQSYEGSIIAQTIPATLALAPHLTVISQPRLALPERALRQADQEGPLIHMEYDGSGRERKLDQIVVDHETGIVEIAEVKRGWRPIGADHRRNRLRDDAALRMLGLSYARRRLRFVGTECTTCVLSYYGRSGLPEHLTVRASELDAHNRWPIRRTVEEHLFYFRFHLDWAVPGLTGAAA